MNAITAAATAAKSTIDRLLSNGKASAASGLIKGEQWDTWAYAEQFSGPEISVNYRREGKTWIYTVTNDAADSIFFSKTGTARTLKEARLEALDAVVAGCAAQPEKAENRAKEELLRLMQNEDHQAAIEDVINSGLLPRPTIQAWLETMVKRAIGWKIESAPDAWKEWAGKFLSGGDVSEASAVAIADAHMGSISTIASIAADLTTWHIASRTMQWIDIAAEVKVSSSAWNVADIACGGIGGDSAIYYAEREHQHRDLLALINEM